MNQSAAPALTRGIQILRALGNGACQTLDELARDTLVPKASLLRLLGVLQHEGAVARDETGRYQARLRLVPQQDTVDFSDRVRTALQALSELNRQTAEWWTPTEAGMLLAARAVPSEGTAAQAMPGFLRPWVGEMDAVACLGHAYCRQGNLQAGKYTHYITHGKPGPLPRRAATSMIRAAQASGTAADAIVNSNGIRRSAALVLHDGQPAGVLAIAEVVTIAGGTQQDIYINRLRQWAQALNESHAATL